MKIWSAPGGRAVATLSAGDEINSVSFMPNGKLFITADAAGRLKVRRTSDLSEVGTIIPIDSKDWVVLDSRGHFDATPDGDKLVAGRSEGKELSRSELKEHCYQAGLLSKLMDASFQASDASKETVNQ
jgi:WD40 repeat protein